MDNCGFVKLSVPDVYANNTDDYWQNFRLYVKAPIDTFAKLTTEKLRWLRKWLDATHTTSFDQTVNLLIVEEVKRRLPLIVLMYVEDQGKRDFMKLAELPDSYLVLINKHSAKENWRG